MSDNSDLLTNFRTCCKAESTSRGFQKGRHRHEFSVFIFRHRLLGFFWLIIVGFDRGGIDLFMLTYHSDSKLHEKQILVTTSSSTKAVVCSVTKK